MRRSPEPAMTMTAAPISSSAGGKTPTAAARDAGTPAGSENAVSLPEGLQDYVDACRQARAAGTTLSAARLRSDMGASAFLAAPAPGVQTFMTFIVLEGREIGVRIHHPGCDAVRPGICYFHGGGFSFGSVDTFDSVAAGLAQETGAVVASVQYRRLPENRCTDALADCYAALVWLHRHAAELNIAPSAIAVAGDSVGAMLATSAAMQARDHGGPALACQILLYGAFALESGRPAYARSRDPLLTGDNVERFIELYSRSRHENDACDPPLAADRLEGLPPAIIIAAEYDPLCEEAMEYAERLAAAGVPAETRLARGMIHGFLRARAMSPAAADEMASIGAMAQRHLQAGTIPQTHRKEDGTA